MELVSELKLSGPSKWSQVGQKTADCKRQKEKQRPSSHQIDLNKKVMYGFVVLKSIGRAFGSG